MAYTDVFSGNTIYPSSVSLLAIALTADIELEWPLESAAPVYPAASIIDVSPDVAGWAISLPDATQAAPGQTILFNNLDGADNFLIKDFDGSTIATVAFGEQWQVYLADNSDAAGTWRVYRFGASIATVQPSALAGPGLVVVGSTLGQSMPVTTFSLSGSTVSTANRAGAFVWIGTGAGTLNLPTAASAANNFFVTVRNEGGGDLTIDPSGSETINGDTTLVLRPGDSAQLITDGVTWYTVGLGQQPVFAFDYTSISVTTGTYTLSGSELNRIAYKFVGVLVGDVTIVVPSTIQQYWINNATTGAFNLSVETAGGTPVTISQGAKGIYYCDGTDLILGSDPTSLTTPITINLGGTGATTASAARLNLGITLFADTIVTATTAAGVRATILAAKSGANSDITSLTGLTTPLTVAQGGTGAATLTGYVKGAGTSALTGVATIPAADGGTGINSYTTGDILYASGATTLGKIPSPAAGYFLSSLGIGVPPAWRQVDLGTTSVTGVLTPANGGTNISSYAVGDLIYASGATTLSKLADVATGNALISGGVTTAPAWGKIGLTTHISGVLPIANGGTNVSAAGIAAFNSITGYTAAGATGTTSTNLVFSTSPTLTTPTINGGVLDGASTVGNTGLVATSIGFRGSPLNTQNGTYSTVLADSGATIYHTSGSAHTHTIDNAVAYPDGTIIVFNNENGAGVLTLALSSGTLRWNSLTGNRSLAPNGQAQAQRMTGGTVWRLTGSGLS